MVGESGRDVLISGLCGGYEYERFCVLDVRGWM